MKETNEHTSLEEAAGAIQVEQAREQEMAQTQCSRRGERTWASILCKAEFLREPAYTVNW